MQSTRTASAGTYLQNLIWWKITSFTQNQQWDEEL